MQLTLENMGFGPFFARQMPQHPELAAFRISAVHRDRLTGLAPDRSRELRTSGGQETGDFAVGDWVLADAEDVVRRRLKRQSLLHRRSAGTGASRQLIAANCDVLFITSSCNADFNPARLERFLVLAYGAGSSPVIVLTKADRAADPAQFAARAQALDQRVPVLTVDARAPADLARVARYCGSGRTAALLGASGVGKTTLTNGLCGRNDATGAARQDDARGRHVTTSRALRRMQNGGWLIDTPGMRALRLEEAAAGIKAMFDDIVGLTEKCRFADCAHDSEPGCAVQAAIAAGRLSRDRLARWQKLRREDMRNSGALARARHASPAKKHRHTAKKVEPRRGADPKA